MNHSNIPDEYCIKGTGFKTLKKYVTKHIGPTYFEEIAKDLGMSNTGLVVSSKWYPVALLIKMQEACARKTESTIEEFSIKSTEFILIEDLLGIYKFVMRLAGIHMLVNKMPLISGIYTNFVKLTVLENTQGRIIARSELPEILAPWYSIASEGAMSGMLKVCKEELKSFEIIQKESFAKGGKEWVSWTYEMKY